MRLAPPAQPDGLITRSPPRMHTDRETTATTSPSAPPANLPSKLPRWLPGRLHAALMPDDYHRATANWCTVLVLAWAAEIRACGEASRRAWQGAREAHGWPFQSARNAARHGESPRHQGLGPDLCRPRA